RPPATRPIWTRSFTALLIFALLLTLIGCDSPPGSEHEPGILVPFLAGTDDVELTYEVDTRERSVPGPGEDLRLLVLSRLGAARIGADVTQDDRRVRIVVDEALRPRVDELVSWTGTLLVLDPDPDLVLTATGSPSELTSRTEGNDHFYEGSRADVLRAID